MPSMHPPSCSVHSGGGGGSPADCSEPPAKAGRCAHLPRQSLQPDGAPDVPHCRHGWKSAGLGGSSSTVPGARLDLEPTLHQTHVHKVGVYVGVWVGGCIFVCIFVLSLSLSLSVGLCLCLCLCLRLCLCIVFVFVFLFLFVCGCVCEFIFFPYSTVIICIFMFSPPPLSAHTHAQPPMCLNILYCISF